MKRFISLLFLFSCSYAWAEWELISSNDDFNYYVDKSTVSRKKNQSKIWIKISYREPRELNNYGKYLSLVSLDLHDCNEKTFKGLSSTAYEDKEAKGKVVYFFTEEESKASSNPIA